MRDQAKTKRQLLEELAEMRRCIGGKQSGTGHPAEPAERTADEIRRSETKYRRLYDSMRDAFVSVTMDGRIQEYNDAYLQMLGYAPEELAALTFRDLTPCKWHAFQDEIIEKQVLARGYSDIYEKEYRRKDGTVVPVELRTVLLRDDEGKPCGMWAILRDITERQRAEADLKIAREALEHRVEDRTAELTRANQQLQQEVEERQQAEAALRESHEQLQAIYDGMVEGLLITDIETQRFLRVNAPICRMLGYAEAELLRASVEDIHPPEEVLNDLRRFQAAAEGRVSINEQRPVLRKDGSIFYADIAGRPILYEGRPCLLALFRDVTERKRAEDARQRQHRTLEHLLRSSDHERQLIAYEIHDGLAQHLAGAIMQLDTYAYQKEGNPNFAAKAFETGMTMLRQGHFEARRLISGVRPPILDEEGAVAAIAHLVNEERRKNGPKIEYFSSVTFERLAPILENAIYRIVQEGLSNACKHSKSRRVQVRLAQEGDRVRVEVQDRGIGFRPEEIEESHFGVAGIRERARLLGGKATIDSAPGKGTRIAVELPVVLGKERDES